MNCRSNTYSQDYQSMAFADSEVVKERALLNDFSDTELFIIDPTKDGIEQITEVLAECYDIKSLNIIASVSGNKDSLKLGSTELNLHTLEAYKDDLQQWKKALSDASEILLYGCLVSIESIFLNFIVRLSEMTGADIGAFVTFSESMTVREQHKDRHSLLVAWQSQ